MNKTNIYFINHSSIQIKKGNLNLLIDPWYFGKVFNNSWCLIEDGHKGLTKGITHIFISHEHPDHLNFGTLKYLKDNDFLSEDCTLIFPYRKEKSVKNAIEKIGILFEEIKDGKNNSISLGEIDCTYYGENEMGDHTMVFDCKDITIINQNDHYTSINTCKRILNDHKKFDFMFTQFSLAGYYGNKNNPEIIKNNGTQYHICKVRDYANIFKPKYLIPFASYIYFCDEYNSYLNNFIVTPDNLIKLNLNYTSLQFVNYGDQIIINKNLVDDRNNKNIENLNYLFSKKSLKIFKSDKINVEKITFKINQHIKKMNFIFWLAFRFLKKRYRGDFMRNKEIKINTNSNIINNKLDNFLKKIIKFINLIKLFGINKRYMYIKLSDYQNCIIRIDTFFTKKVDLVDNIKNVDFVIPSQQLDFALTVPWGVDTLNITATGEYYSALPDVLMQLVKKNNLRK